MKIDVKHVAKLDKVEPYLNLKGKVAVFIDAANIELSAKDLGFRVDYKKLLGWLKQESKSDFHYLIKELKRRSKMVAVASLKYHVSRELVEASDFYLDLRKVRYLIQREREKKA